MPALIRRRAAAAEALGRIENGSGLQPAFWRLPYGEPVWVDVPAGEFAMGGDSQYDGKPVHCVNLPAFKIAKVPITNTQYRFFVEAMRYEAPRHWSDGKIPRGMESHPVVNVSWYDVLKYCEWLSIVTDKAITLPGEAQWEKAARGGERVGTYPWGGKWDETKCNMRELDLGGTTPVGIFPEGCSPYGCLDMAGNVWEWTLSKFKNYPYQANDGRNETDRSDAARVVRGGSWLNGQDYARCAFRYSFRSDRRDDNNGFRCVVSRAPEQTGEMV